MTAGESPAVLLQPSPFSRRRLNEDVVSVRVTIPNRRVDLVLGRPTPYGLQYNKMALITSDSR